VPGAVEREGAQMDNYVALDLEAGRRAIQPAAHWVEASRNRKASFLMQVEKEKLSKEVY
jgi:hypothetical protein